jgi:toxin CcdB
VTAARRAFPLVVCLQSGLVANGGSRVVAPLIPRRGIPGTPGRFSPVIAIDEAEYVVLVDRIVNLPARDLSGRVANLASHREALLGAVDLLFYGV